MAKDIKNPVEVENLELTEDQYYDMMEMYHEFESHFIND
jgi:hypothetical protein